jgi:putative membrane protein
MTERRRPASFRIEPEVPPQEPARPAEPPKARKPRTADPARVEPAEFDVFDEVDALEAAPPPPALPPRRRSRLRAIFFWAVGLLLSLAVGLWTEALVRELFARAEWLGWVGLALALVALAALVIIIVREAMALARLASVARLHERGLEAIAANDPKKARALVDELAGFVAAQPETAAGRRALEELRGDIIDGADLVRLAEVELLAPLDERARRLTLDAAKRVSLVTAVSPRALVDLAYVAFESARLIRRIAELYGARPGTLGFPAACPQRDRPSGHHRRAGRRRRVRAPDRRPGARRTPFGQAGRRHRQRHDDGQDRHRRHGDLPPPALLRRQAPGPGRLSLRAGGLCAQVRPRLS